MLFSVADLFSLSLPFRRHSSNSFIIISISFCESKCGGGFLVPCVDSVGARSVWNLGEFFVDFLGLTAPG